MKTYKTKDDVWHMAQTALGRALRDFIPAGKLDAVEAKLRDYGSSRKGYFGDGECIVAKIRNGQAHLLSEGDTFYLGACTKGSQWRSQSESAVPAKPWIFSL